MNDTASPARTVRRRNRFPADLDPASVVALQDSREQDPACLDPLRVEIATLTTADYSVRGLEDFVAVERKSLPDFVACCGVERARFERELIRLGGYPVRAVVIEAHWGDLEAGEWRSKLKPQSVIGSLLSWTNQGIPFLLVGNHERAGKAISRMLYLAARKRWREARLFATGVLEAEEAVQ